MKQTRTSLQYKPQAWQFSSSLRPRRRRGVWVAPQFKHSALTPPGPELPFPRRTAGLTLVAAAPGPEERVVGAFWVFTVRLGRLLAALARVPALGPSLAREIVSGGLSSGSWVRENVVMFDSLLLWEDWESEEDTSVPEDSRIMTSESEGKVNSVSAMRLEDKLSSVASTLLRISSSGSSMVGRRTSCGSFPELSRRYEVGLRD